MALTALLVLAGGKRRPFTAKTVCRLSTKSIASRACTAHTHTQKKKKKTKIKKSQQQKKKVLSAILKNTRSRSQEAAWLGG